MNCSSGYLRAGDAITSSAVNKGKGSGTETKFGTASACPDSDDVWLPTRHN